MKLKRLVILFSLLSVSSVYGQDDLDAIFDDGQSTSGFTLRVGSDLLTFMGGTANVYGEAQYKQKLGVQIGVGVSPFGYLMDLSSPALIDDFDNALISDLNGAFYYHLGVKYLSGFGDVFNWYYYVDWKRWNGSVVGPFIDEYGNLIVDTYNFTRSKFNFGMGYAYMPFDHVGFDGHGGIYMQKQIETGETYGSRQVGFDLGIGAFYQF